MSNYTVALVIGLFSFSAGIIGGSIITRSSPPKCDPGLVDMGGGICASQAAALEMMKLAITAQSK